MKLKDWRMSEAQLCYIISAFLVVLAFFFVKPIGRTIFRSIPNAMLIILAFVVTMFGYSKTLPKLKESTAFILTFLLTILLIRLVLYLHPFDVIYHGKELHHFWFGLLFFISGLIIINKRKYLKIFLLGVGLGALVDELLLILMKLSSDIYWSGIYIIEIIILSILIIYYRENILKFLMKVKRNETKGKGQEEERQG
jgi:hypothetical protein